MQIKFILPFLLFMIAAQMGFSQLKINMEPEELLFEPNVKMMSQKGYNGFYRFAKDSIENLYGKDDTISIKIYNPKNQLVFRKEFSVDNSTGKKRSSHLFFTYLPNGDYMPNDAKYYYENDLLVREEIYYDYNGLPRRVEYEYSENKKLNKIIERNEPYRFCFLKNNRLDSVQYAQFSYKYRTYSYDKFGNIIKVYEKEHDEVYTQMNVEYENDKPLKISIISKEHDVITNQIISLTYKKDLLFELKMIKERKGKSTNNQPTNIDDKEEISYRFEYFKTNKYQDTKQLDQAAQFKSSSLYENKKVVHITYDVNGTIRNKIVKNNFNENASDNYTYNNSGQLIEFKKIANDNQRILTETYYDSGELKRKTVRDDKGNDNFKSFYRSGALQKEKLPKTNEFKDEYVEYYESGQKKELTIYLTTKKGYLKTTKKYYSNGKLMKESQTLNNQKTGVWKTYNEDGSIKEKIKY